MMTLNESLNIILNHSAYYEVRSPDDTDYDKNEWDKAFNEVTDRLGVFYDDKTNQFVTKDTGHVI